MVYQWKKGSYIKANPQIAGEMCEQLEKTVGLSAQTLLDANRDKDAPLHSCFEWNNKKAAEEYRLYQSRHIINCLCYKVDEGEKKEPLRVFFNITRADNNYESLNVILSEEDKYRQLLDRALSELKAFERKYSQLTELEQLFGYINELTGRCRNKEEK